MDPTVIVLEDFGQWQHDINDNSLDAESGIDDGSASAPTSRTSVPDYSTTCAALPTVVVDARRYEALLSFPSITGMSLDQIRQQITLINELEAMWAIIYARRRACQAIVDYSDAHVQWLAQHRSAGSL
ncbi:unnamed protein product [Parajaminaea phylloscopi]